MPLLRNPLLWTSVAWISSAALLGASIAVLIAVPGPRDGAVAIGVCAGLPILRQEDGSVWLRVSGIRAYRIEDDWREICR